MFPKTQSTGRQHDDSGFNVGVSDASWKDLAVQATDAEFFLREHRDELERLSNFPGVTDIVLDFPIDLRIDGENVVVQSDQLSATLVSLAGNLRMALAITIYPPGSDEDEHL